MNMKVGAEFSSWEHFQKVLDQYSQENKVVYTLGTCKSAEIANKNELLHNKFPLKFKYCFARLVCKHYGNYASRSGGQRPNQRTCKTGCTSSILVSVNKERSSLVVKDANLQHSHAVSESIFSSYSQTRRLQGDERRIASILLRAGVPLLRVQEFVSHACRKDPTIKDLRNLRSSDLRSQGALVDSEAEKFAFLSDVDHLMAEDSSSIVEIINFDLVPGAIYIQTSGMIEKTKMIGSGLIQIVSHSLNDGKVLVVSIIGKEASATDPFVLALCVIMVTSDTALHCFFEAFVRNNATFCDSVKGIVLDCSKDNADFLQQLIPQAYLAWSQSYILEKFEEKSKLADLDSGLRMQLLKNLMNSETEEIYRENLKLLSGVLKASDYEDFVQTWECSKELWARYEISSYSSLSHQKDCIELHYMILLKKFLRASMTSSELIRALLRFVRNERPEEGEDYQSLLVESDPSVCFYQQFCFPEACHAIECQLALAQNSCYEINQQVDGVMIKRKDSEEEHMLDTLRKKCSCSFSLKKELPCQHLFAWLKFSGKPLIDESLVPVKWQVFGSAITLDALAESLSQGNVPSSLDHDERIRELQGVVKDVLASCCSHSYQRMGDDIALLRQVLALVKSSPSHGAKVVIGKSDTDIKEGHSDVVVSQALTANNLGCPPGKRGRGRPSNKERLLRMEQEERKRLDSRGLNEPCTSKPVSPSSSQPINTNRQFKGAALTSPPGHNLRRNIKHKFVTREISDKASSPGHLISNEVATVSISCESYVAQEDIGLLPSTASLSVVQVEEDTEKVVTSVLSQDRTEMYRAVRTKSSLGLDNSTSTDLPTESMGDSFSGPNIVSNASAVHSVNSDSVTSVRQATSNKRPSDSTVSPMAKRKKSSRESEDEEEDDSTECSTEEESDEDPLDKETIAERKERIKDKLLVAVNRLPQNSLNEILQAVALMDSSDDREQFNGNMTECEVPADVVVNTCKDLIDMVVVAEFIYSICPGFDQHVYQVATALFCRANTLAVSVTDLIQSLSSWPSHLPDMPLDRPFEGETTLEAGQTLTVCGHKLGQEDMDSLQPGHEISSVTVHAYLNTLAQRHNGKMFVLPFSLVHVWRNGSYTDMLFKKVHFKTFEYLVLPIHCGGEFSPAERESGDLVQPCWMALVADMKERTVGVLIPRTEDRYIIAANGYMLQWRRYMQIRSVHTREMLSAWTIRHRHCNQVDRDGCSAIMLIMNVEALLCDVHPVVMHPDCHAARYRHLVASCLRDTDWQTTVLCVGGPECQQKAARDADWLQCDNCRAWWHRACAFITPNSLTQRTQQEMGKGSASLSVSTTSGTFGIKNTTHSMDIPHGDPKIGNGDNRDSEECDKTKTTCKEPFGVGSSQQARVFYCTSCRQRIQALKESGVGGVLCIDGVMSNAEEDEVMDREELDREEDGEEEEEDEVDNDQEIENEISEGRPDEDGEEIMRIEEVLEEEKDIKVENNGS